MSIRIGKKIISGNEKGKLSVPLLTPVFFDYKLNDISWLRSDTFSWHSGDTYSEVYNHLLSDMSSGYKEVENYGSSNVALVGNVFDNDGVLSGFHSTTSYVTFKVQKPTSSFELVIKTSGSSSAWASQIIATATTQYKGFVLRFDGATLKCWMSGNGTSWNIMSGYNPSLTIPTGVNVWFKIAWNGTQYIISYSTDGNTWVNGNPLASTVAPYWDEKSANIGGCSWESYPFRSAVYLDGSYLKVDGNIIWHGINTWKSFKAADGHEIVFSGNEEQVQKEYLKNGSAWYYILDTTKKMFKLPRGHSTRVIKSYNNGLSWYRLYADGWIEQGGRHTLLSNAYEPISFLLSMKTSNYFVSAIYNDINTTDGTVHGINTGKYTSSSFDVKIGTSGTTATITWQVSGYADVDSDQTGDKYLYFYVGSFSKTAIEQTAGITSEQLNNKVDIGHQVIAFQAPTVENNYTWYRCYADGWVEQGGTIATTASYENHAVTLPVKMQDGNYFVQKTMHGGANLGTNFAWRALADVESGQTNTDTIVNISTPTSAQCLSVFWEVKGMAA